MSETNGSSVGRRERRKFSAAEKLRIVLAGLQADTKVSELCRREGISATQFYQWKDRSAGLGGQGLRGQGEGPSAGKSGRRRNWQRMKDVIAEITAENVELKKTLSD